MECHRTSQNVMESDHGRPWNTMERHGIMYILLEYSIGEVYKDTNFQGVGGHDGKSCISTCLYSLPCTLSLKPSSPRHGRPPPGGDRSDGTIAASRWETSRVRPRTP